jgi:hypothetical protein
MTTKGCQKPLTVYWATQLIRRLAQRKPVSKKKGVSTVTLGEPQEKLCSMKRLRVVEGV